MRADKAKRGFLLYKFYEKGFNVLADADAGKLIKAIFAFVTTGEIVEVPPSAYPLYMVIIDRLEEDKAAYDEMCRKRAEYGKQGGRPPQEQEEE